MEDIGDLHNRSLHGVVGIEAQFEWVVGWGSGKTATLKLKESRKIS